MLILKNDTRDLVTLQSEPRNTLISASVMALMIILFAGTILVFHWYDVHIDCRPNGKGTFNCDADTKLLFGLMTTTQSARNVKQLEIREEPGDADGIGYSRQAYFVSDDGRLTRVTSAVVRNDQDLYQAITERFNASFESNSKMRLDAHYSRQLWQGKLALVMGGGMLLWVLLWTLGGLRRPLSISLNKQNRTLVVRERRGKREEEITFTSIQALRCPSSKELKAKFLPNWAKKMLPDAVSAEDGVDAETTAKVSHFIVVLQSKHKEPRWIILQDQANENAAKRFFSFAQDSGLNNGATS